MYALPVAYSHTPPAGLTQIANMVSVKLGKQGTFECQLHSNRSATAVQMVMHRDGG